MNSKNSFADFQKLLGLEECWNPQLTVNRPMAHAVPMQVYCETMGSVFVDSISLTIRNPDGSWQICTNRETSRGTMLHTIHSMQKPNDAVDYWVLTIAKVETRIPTLLADQAIRINAAD